MILLLLTAAFLGLAILALIKNWDSSIYALAFIACAICVLIGFNNPGTLVSSESKIEYLAPVNGYIVNDEGRYVTTGNRFGQLNSVPVSGGIPAKFEKDLSLLTITREFKPNNWAWFFRTETETKLTSIKPPALK